MSHFDKIAEVLTFIDAHLNEALDFKQIAETFHFSPFYFHRLFTAIVGKPVAAYVRDRRLLKACGLLSGTDVSIISICYDCGFDSSQAFSRTFKQCFGVSPSNYRRLGYQPAEISVQELIVKFTNRLQGGILVTPNMIKIGALLVAGITGDGNDTAALWQRFMELNKNTGLGNKLSDNGFEIRAYQDGKCQCHVGIPVSDPNVDRAFSLFQLPASQYASFDVFVARGYNSENAAISEWLSDNKLRYKQRMLDCAPYIIEFYDERFHGDYEDSIVEIWVPVEEIDQKKRYNEPE